MCRSAWVGQPGLVSLGWSAWVGRQPGWVSLGWSAWVGRQPGLVVSLGWSAWVGQPGLVSLGGSAWVGRQPGFILLYSHAALYHLQQDNSGALGVVRAMHCCISKWAISPCTFLTHWQVPCTSHQTTWTGSHA